jgi:Flp pilus assembly protein TadD
LLPGIGLVFIAGLALLFYQYRAKQKTSPEAVPQGQFQQSEVSTGATTPSIKPAATNISEAEAGEDRVVALVSEGNELLARGDYARAAEKYEEAVRLEPGSEDLHYNLGIALARLGRTEDARQHYQKALEIFPEYGEAHNNLGNLLMSQNKLDEAIEHFREAIKINPNDASFHNNLGTALGRQGKAAEAVAEFREATKLKPGYLDARINLGNACLASGLVEEAIMQFEEALRLQPDSQRAFQGLQRARQKQGANPIPK